MSSSGFPNMRDRDIQERVQQRATDTMKVLEHLSHEESLFSLKERRLKGKSY